jgi:hypothetical protein
MRRRSVVSIAGLLGLSLCAAQAHAQTWSVMRERPSLFEIIAVDATGDASWPFGQEDVAGDGASTEQADEAAIDVRSVYADVRAERLWLRAYVAGKIVPDKNAVAFFFIDDDARTSSGGKAEGNPLGFALGADPTPGGYERAIGVRGDGTLLGVFFWDTSNKQWSQQPDKPVLASSEAGATRDPLRLLGDDHGYFQVDSSLASVGLDAACSGTIFVRTWNDATGKRAFGDDASERAFECHAKLDTYGNPELLQSGSCKNDAGCPAQGQCRSGICLFSYECVTDEVCPSGEHCSGGACVKVVDQSCKQSADCAGLICDAGHCVACSATGAHACASGYLCAPDGSCLRAADGGSAGKNAGSAGHGSAAGSGGARVRGGAFTCSAARAGHTGSAPLWLLLGLFAAGRGRRRFVMQERDGGAR